MFFENDRTFCNNEDCECRECYRHLANVVGKPRFLSLSMFEGTKECLKLRSCTECKHFLSCEKSTHGMPCSNYKEGANESHIS